MLLRSRHYRAGPSQVQQWLSEIGKHAPEGVGRILIGNKSDLAEERQVTEEEARALAESLGIGQAPLAPRRATAATA